MFRIMFNTSFVRSNILSLVSEEIDVLWDAKDQFSKDFRAEVLFSDVGAVPVITTTEIESDDDNETDSASLEEFFKAEEIFSNTVDAQDEKADFNAPLNYDGPSNGEGDNEVQEDRRPPVCEDFFPETGSQKHDSRTVMLPETVKDIGQDDWINKHHLDFECDLNAVKDILMDDTNLKEDVNMVINDIVLEERKKKPEVHNTPNEVHDITIYDQDKEADIMTVVHDLFVKQEVSTELLDANIDVIKLDEKYVEDEREIEKRSECKSPQRNLSSDIVKQKDERVLQPSPRSRAEQNYPKIRSDIRFEI